MTTATRTARIKTTPFDHKWPFNSNEHPTIDTAAGVVSVDFQTDGFRPEYNGSIGSGDHETYRVYFRFEDSLTINGKQYFNLEARTSGHQNKAGDTFHFQHLYVQTDGCTSAAQNAINDAVMPVFTAWVQEQGGFPALCKQARNASRIRHAEYMEREAERKLTEAAKVRSQIEN